MSETQTTEERVYEILLGQETYAKASYIIADEIDALTAQRDEARMDHDRVYHDAEELAAEVMQTRTERDAARAGVEKLKLPAWGQVFEFQAKYANTWRDKAESYWLARFMEEVGELAGALVGNHVGPVEWELSQLAAIALNWLDMRAARARAREAAEGAA